MSKLERINDQEAASLQAKIDSAVETQRIDWFESYGFLGSLEEHGAEVAAGRLTELEAKRLCLPKDLRVQVSVYAVTRHLGGREEGGWWYNWQDFTGISERVYPEHVDETRARLEAMYEDQQPKHDIYSMANESPQYEVIIEMRAGENQTTEKPRYC